MPVEELSKILLEAILPNLNRIQASQSEQMARTESLSRSLDEFRAEMKARFAELHAELAAARLQMDATMASLRESEARVAAVLGVGRNQIIH